ncbi:MAG: DUF502 domain-containing protein, partial [Myxococcales bacterium]|nr:DUF502 domain-containing protein [Myxococcales bacterium]
ASTYLGRHAIRLLEQVLGRLPVIRSVYPKFRHAVSVVSLNESNALKHFVLAELGDGHWQPAFVTGEATWTRKGSQRRHFVLYVPSSTFVTGDLYVMDEERVLFLEMTVDEGVTAFLTGGLTLDDSLGDGHFVSPPKAPLFGAPDPQ